MLQNVTLQEFTLQYIKLHYRLIDWFKIVTGIFTFYSQNVSDQKSYFFPNSMSRFFINFFLLSWSNYSFYNYPDFSMVQEDCREATVN